MFHFLQGEEIFLDMFEDEYRSMMVRPTEHISLQLLLQSHFYCWSFPDDAAVHPASEAKGNCCHPNSRIYCKKDRLIFIVFLPLTKHFLGVLFMFDRFTLFSVSLCLE